MNSDRKSWMSVLAKSRAKDMDRLWAAIEDQPSFKMLRAPEIGAVMVRGRMGATGDAFNLGEMTITRCSVELATGEIGHGYVQGRDRRHSERAAILDALLQGPRNKEVVDHIITPLRDLRAGKKDKRAKKAAATKVDFFTLARGEDE